MFNYKKTIFIAFSLLPTYNLIAQSTGTPAAENTFMRSEAKIYVVMIVVITILAGLLYYLFRLDNKLTKLEKRGNV